MNAVSGVTCDYTGSGGQLADKTQKQNPGIAPADVLIWRICRCLLSKLPMKSI